MLAVTCEILNCRCLIFSGVVESGAVFFFFLMGWQVSFGQKKTTYSLEIQNKKFDVSHSHVVLRRLFVGHAQIAIPEMTFTM